MNTLKRSAILIRLARRMHEQGSWCGETHLQKAVYLLQDVAGADTGFEFVLYKHGPFSFDLRDQLTSMRADELLELLTQPQPYGPKLAPTDNAGEIESKFPKTLKNHRARIDFVVEAVGDKGVSELERLATAVYIVRRDLPDKEDQIRAKRVNQIKPHIPPTKALEAIQEAKELLRDAITKGLTNDAQSKPA